MWLVEYESHSGSDIFKSNGGQFRRQLHPDDRRVFRRRDVRLIDSVTARSTAIFEMRRANVLTSEDDTSRR